MMLGICLLIGCNSSSSKSAVKPVEYKCEYTPVDKGSRRFGMDILNGTYSSNLSQLQNLGGSFNTFPVEWTALEPTPNNLVDPGNALASFNSIANSTGVKLSLVIRPVDTTGKTVPSDLVNTRFNDSAMINRFIAVIDFVLTRVGQTNLVNIMVGNEINDYHPGTDTNFWADYGAFLYQLRLHVNSQYPGLKLGFVGTLYGFTDATKLTPDGLNAQTVLTSIANAVEVVGVTYYPINPDFSVKSVSVVSTDIQNLVNIIPSSASIHIQEAGYPTSATNNSSENLQSQFFCELLHAWDTHATRISQLAVLRMNDITRAEAVTMASNYGSSSEAFIEYLRSLGVFQKQGFELLDEELGKRNF